MHCQRVVDYMTVSAETLEMEQPLAEASVRMRELGVLHLPVLDHGHLRGVLWRRDLALVESLPQSSAALSVGDVMGVDLYPVTASAPLGHVARTLAEHDYPCAVVMEHGSVRGTLTAAQALRALAGLSEQGEVAESMGPSEVRAVILTEHAHVTTLIERTRLAARRAQHGTDALREARSLRDAARHLLTAMCAHLDLEDRILAPALAELPGFGKQRAEQLIDEHRHQTIQTDSALLALENPDPAALAQTLERVMTKLETELAREEELLLNLDLLRDDGIVTECDAG
jgi:acetoin utilization protein AcuB